MSNDPFYRTRLWQATRNRQLTMEPWCRTCAKLGLLTKATHVDHIVARAKGGAPYAAANLRSLCDVHHNQKTGFVDSPHSREDGHKAAITGPDGYPIDTI